MLPHPQYPKKRSQLKFQDIPASCGTVLRHILLLMLTKQASSYSVNRSPLNSSCTIQAHRVLKPWRESQATSLVSQLSSPNWASIWLGLDDTDADLFIYCLCNMHAYRITMTLDIVGQPESEQCGQWLYQLQSVCNDLGVPWPQRNKLCQPRQLNS